MSVNFFQSGNDIFFLIAVIKTVDHSGGDVYYCPVVNMASGTLLAHTYIHTYIHT